MPRKKYKNRPSQIEETNFDHIIFSSRTQERRGYTWKVQHIPSQKAVKIYICPGCTAPIDVGIAHVVTWRVDGLMGEQDGLNSRRHWHSHCWRIS